MKMIHLLLAATTLRPVFFDSPMIEISYGSEDDIPPEYKALYTEKDGAWSLTGVKGMKTGKDVSTVSEALRKERADHSKLRAGLRSVFGEQYDLTEIGERLTKVDELQALVDGGDFKDPKKLDNLVQAKLKALLTPVERERDQLKSQIGTLTAENENFKTAGMTRKIHDAVREAGGKSKLLGDATDDALMLAERQLTVDENGNVVTKEVAACGPGLTAVDWLGDLQTKRPHWWGTSSGGGSGNGMGGSKGPNPWSADGWNLTEQGRIYKENPTRAKTLADAVGVKVTGGVRPTKK